MNKKQYNIILFNCTKKLKAYHEIENTPMLAIDFRKVIMETFEAQVVLNENHLNIQAPTFKAYCGTTNTPTKSIEVDIYGEQGFLAFENLASKMAWQIFDKRTNCFL